MTPAEMAAGRYAELQRAVQAIAAPAGLTAQFDGRYIEINGLYSAEILIDMLTDDYDNVSVHREQYSEIGPSFCLEHAVAVGRIAEQVKGYLSPRADADGHQIGAGAVQSASPRTP